MDETQELYKLIIVDDEAMIRSGLADVVDWKALGFSVDHVFDDGRAAIEYLGVNEIDVILTDIRMNSVSGLELARYVKENAAQIKVVIITGFKEFEYAREAVVLAVFDFLLKPTNLSRIRDVFSRLKRQLDGDRERIRSMDETRRLASMALLRELADGKVAEPARLEEWSRVVGLDFDMESPCCELHADIKAAPSFAHIPIDAPLRLFHFEDSHGGVRYLLVGEASCSPDQFRSAAVKFADTVQETLSRSLDIQIRLSLGECFATLRVYALRQRDQLNGTDIHDDTEPEHSYNSKLIHRAKEYVAENYMRDISLEEVAEHVYLSSAYFSAYFRRWAGINFIEYLTDYRIRQGRILLESGKIKIAEAAASVGYSNSKYFARVFKKHTGRTPSEFLRERLFRGDS